MSAVDLSLNYEDLLQTVKESDRGRWFLTEFENRLRKSDTGNILASIAKLEGVIAGMGAIGGSGADAALVARAKSAIAVARKEIAALDASKAELSDEGRLFSKLADMARTAFSTESQGMNPVNAASAAPCCWSTSWTRISPLLPCQPQRQPSPATQMSLKLPQPPRSSSLQPSSLQKCPPRTSNAAHVWSSARPVKKTRKSPK